MRKPSNGRVRASVWAGTSTIFPQSGSIWTRTASRREYPCCPLGLFRRTGVKECDPRAGMATERQTQDPKRGVRTEQPTTIIDKPPLAQLPQERLSWRVRRRRTARPARGQREGQVADAARSKTDQGFRAMSK